MRSIWSTVSISSVAAMVAFCARHLVRGLMGGRIRFIAGMTSPEFLRTESPVGFWLAALILIYAARARSSRGNTRVLEQPAGGRHKCAMLLRQLSKSGLLLVLFMLVLYVLVSTVLLDQMQTEYDRQIARFADPNWMTKEIEAEIQKLALPPPGSVDNSTAP